MKTIGRSAFLFLIPLLLVTAGVAQNPNNVAPVAQQQTTVAPVAGPAQVQPQSPCGNQALCTDTPDFTATITDFRQTVSNGMKVLDITVRFQNKTSDTLILGYADGSEMVLDDQGNRYVPNPWGNAYRGIGVVSGNNMDPKFVMRPGSWGDARFELVWRPGAQDPIGSTFEYALSIREINTIAGNQHTLGGEFPVHFQGLVNGAGAASPGYSNTVNTAGAVGAGGGASAGSAMLASGSSLPPCGASGTVGAVTNAANSTGNQTASNAASQASNAASTLSSLGSLFSRKKQQANAAASTTNASAPCAPATVPGSGSVPPTTAGAAVPTTATNAANRTGAAVPTTATTAGKVVSTSQNKAAIPAATNAKAPVAAAAAAATAAPAAKAPAAAKPAAQPATAAKTATPAPAAKKPVPAKPADQTKPTQP